MRNLRKKVSLVVVSALALLGLGIASKNAEALDNTDQKPLVLEHGSNIGGIFVADDEGNHYSHESHASHASHESHSSGY